MKKAKEMKQIHGKVETFKKTTLDQVWGDDGGWKYKTMDVGAYRASLAEMNLIDLQTHAASLGEVPISERERLTKKLVARFQEHVANYRIPDNKPKQIKLSKKAAAILAEGR